MYEIKLKLNDVIYLKKKRGNIVLGVNKELLYHKKDRKNDI